MQAGGWRGGETTVAEDIVSHYVVGEGAPFEVFEPAHC